MNAEEHQQDLNLVHELLQKHQLFLCIDKSTFFPPRVLFCGYIIDKDGVHMDPEKIKVIPGWPAPTIVHEVRQITSFDVLKISGSEAYLTRTTISRSPLWMLCR